MEISFRMQDDVYHGHAVRAEPVGTELGGQVISWLLPRVEEDKVTGLVAGDVAVLGGPLFS